MAQDICRTKNSASPDRDRGRLARTSGARDARGPMGCSEVGLAGDRHLVVEQMLVVFGASFFMHGHLDPLEIVDG